MAGEDLGQQIAENVGYMPVVKKIGDVSGGLGNFLSSLFSSAPAPAAPAAAPAAAPGGGGFIEFLSSLLGPLQTGARSSLDALQGDVSKVGQGKLPPALMKDAVTAMAMTGRGGLGPGLPRVRATRSAKKMFDPDKGWFETDVVETPSVDPLKSVAQGNIFGSDFSNTLLKIIDAMRQNTRATRDLP